PNHTVQGNPSAGDGGGTGLSGGSGGRGPGGVGNVQMDSMIVGGGANSARIAQIEAEIRRLQSQVIVTGPDGTTMIGDSVPGYPSDFDPNSDDGSSVSIVDHSAQIRILQQELDQLLGHGNPSGYSPNPDRKSTRL